MLPWRRNKFVLVDEERPGKAKSLGPGLSYASLLSGFLRSCPDLLPGCPLERLGRVFRSRRHTVELNREDPTYTAWYLGSAVTLQAKGEGCTDEAVGKIWAKSGRGASGTRVKLTLGAQGIRMAPCEPRGGGRGGGGRRPGHAYLLRRITYGAADARHPKLLAWVYRHQAKHKAVVLRCHAALLAKAETARAAARLLRQAASAAFSDFQRLQRRNDARRLQRQRLGDAVVPLAPARQRLNGPCPYRPPADRSRARRLSAILEEEEEENRGSPGRQAPAAPQRRERAEVLTLAREMRGWSLQSPPPWKPAQEGPCWAGC
uniref:Family with sequence similarity 43 member B n=1 Tax=Chelydra serpentina TaxID=8475 RepID=A0A8C3SWD9_CHESE